ncbi:MAG: tetratricopeptide repeat protein [Magnetococcales bacterium]|nr:tetratricopeptide repeat protein [Magnetococcales bacterium]
MAGKKGLVLFIHGLGGDETTWGDFPRLLREDAGVAARYEVRVWQYPTSLNPVKHNPRIQKIAEGLGTELGLVEASEIVLICHSMGGLVARQMLLARKLAKDPLLASRLLLFATPNNGADLARYLQISPQISQMNPESDFLDMLNQGWADQKMNKQVITRFVVADDDNVVEEQSARGFWGSKHVFRILGKGHIDVVKPRNREDQAFKIARKFLLDGPPPTPPGLPLEPLGLIEGATGVQKLNPRARSVKTLVGREGDLGKMRAWLDSDKAVAVRALIGDGGRGKTRLAVELCLEYQEKGWHTGFLSGAKIPATSRWSRDTLAVIDYAANHAAAIRQWLEALAEAADPASKLRLLLLERHGEEDAGWWQTVRGVGGWGNAVTKLLDPAKPEELPPLDKPAGLALLEHVSPGMASPAAPLVKQDWWGEPLFILMAGQIQGNPWAMNRLELAQALVDKEENRIVSRSDSEAQAMLLRHLAAYTTLCGGLNRPDLEEVCEQELKKRRANGDIPTLADKLHALFPADSGAAALLPDLLGELLILKNLGNGDAPSAQAAALRAFDRGGLKAVTAALRCVQDYGRYGYEQPLHWLDALVDQQDLPVERLLAITDAKLLPDYHLDLNAFTAKVEGAIIQRLRDSKATDLASRAQLARFLNNYSVRLGHLGRSAEGLKPAEEAVEIYRELEKQFLEVFRPELAKSLNTLANRLRDVDSYEQAIIPSYEAVKIYRELSMQHSDYFSQYLAGSLANLAISLSQVGRSVEALSNTLESVNIRRELAEQHPKLYLPYFAMSLNNLANILSELGQREEALAPALEAVGIYRELARQQPEAFRHYLAGTLNNLARYLNEDGRSAEALSPAQESVTLFRELFNKLPDAFRRNWIISLGVLADILRQLDNIKEAEAIEAELAGLG